jgi:hypothetical protein
MEFEVPNIRKWCAENYDNRRSICKIVIIDFREKCSSAFNEIMTSVTSTLPSQSYTISCVHFDHEDNTCKKQVVDQPLSVRTVVETRNALKSDRVPILSRSIPKGEIGEIMDVYKEDSEVKGYYVSFPGIAWTDYDVPGLGSSVYVLKSKFDSNLIGVRDAHRKEVTTIEARNWPPETRTRVQLGFQTTWATVDDPLASLGKLYGKDYLGGATRILTMSGKDVTDRVTHPEGKGTTFNQQLPRDLQNEKFRVMQEFNRQDRFIDDMMDRACSSLEQISPEKWTALAC